MFNKQVLIRFVEAFVAIFIVALAADPILAGGSVDLFGSGGLTALIAAAASAVLIALRGAFAAATAAK